MPDAQAAAALDGWTGADVPTAPSVRAQELEHMSAALEEEPTRTDAVNQEVLAALSSAAPAPDAPPSGASDPVERVPEIQAPTEASEPLRETQPEPLFTDLEVESTAIVDPSKMQRPEQVLTLDLESGQVSSEAVAFDEADWQPGRKRSTGLIVGGVLALVVLLGGIGAAVMFGGDEQPSEPVASLSAAGAEGDTAEEGDAESPAAETEGSDPVDQEEDPSEGAAELDSPVPARSETDPADTPPLDGDEPADHADATPSAGASTVAEIEAFELVRPETSSRARRMSDGDRRRQAGRFRARGLRAYRGGHWSDAARLFRQALSYNGWDIASVEGLARTHAQQNNFPEAVAWANLAVQRNPRSPATFRVLGDVWRQAGHLDRAREVWQRGLRRHSHDRWLRRRLRELDE